MNIGMTKYEKRFFRAPVDGIVTEVLVEVGKPVTIATHVFTIRNDDTFNIPVTVLSIQNPRFKIPDKK